MNSENTPKVLEIIDLIKDKKESKDFREPVDYEALNLSDYPIIIERMMDLQTLKENLEKGSYQTVN